MEGGTIMMQLQNSLTVLFNEVMAFLPQLVAALAILVAGWIVGKILGKAVARLFKTLHLDVALDKAGVDDLANRAGFAFKPASFTGGLVKWFIILAFTVVALNVLNLTAVTAFMSDIIGYLPQVLAAALIIFVGLIAGNFARTIVSAAVTSAQTISSAHAPMLGSVAYYAVLAFAIMAALNQMNIAPELIQILFTAIVGALALAFGLAFGLGGRDAAGRYVDRVTRTKG